jgi:hypothetical protein
VRYDIAKTRAAIILFQTSMTIRVLPLKNNENLNVPVINDLP